MTTIAVIGLGSFGCRIVEELIETQAELIILDRDREIVEKYKNSVVNAYITDAISEETLKKVIPLDINAAIVDLGSQLESSILVTNHLIYMLYQLFSIHQKCSVLAFLHNTKHINIGSWRLPPSP